MRSRITAATRSGSATRSSCASTRCPAAAAGGCPAAEPARAGFQRPFEAIFIHPDRRGAPRRTPMASPKKLAHLVLQPNPPDQMGGWYFTLLRAEALVHNNRNPFTRPD